MKKELEMARGIMMLPDSPASQREELIKYAELSEEDPKENTKNILYFLN